MRVDQVVKERDDGDHQKVIDTGHEVCEESGPWQPVPEFVLKESWLTWWHVEIPQIAVHLSGLQDPGRALLEEDGPEHDQRTKHTEDREQLPQLGQQRDCRLSGTASIGEEGLSLPVRLFKVKTMIRFCLINPLQTIRNSLKK